MKGKKATFLLPPISNDMRDFEKWLDLFLNFEKLPQKNIFWLDKVQALCGILENPQKKIPCVHVAGSKGKGSISCMTANIIQQATGLPCGLYSSPHIINFLERIKTSCGYFPKQIYESAAKKLKIAVEIYEKNKMAEDRPLTWFELVTVFCFLCFSLSNIPYCVYEVGLGGRLDATNVINPKVCCIAQIELEHTQFLGNTIQEIALQKAGIIKPDTPVVVYGKQTKEALNIFSKVAKQNNSPILNTQDYFSNEKSEYIRKKGKIFQRVSFDCSFSKGSQKKQERIECDMQLLGDFQIENAKCAVLLSKILLCDLKTSDIERGLSSSFLPARFEQTKVQGLDVVLDAAHTVNSTKSLIATYQAVKNVIFPVVLFSCADDKDIFHIAPLFKDFACLVVLTTLKEKHTDIISLQNAFKNAKVPYIKEEDTKLAMKKALQETKKQKTSLVVTGSFYLVSEFQKEYM